MHAIDYMVMAAYLATVVGVGLWFSRGDRDTDAYLLGGRAMPWPIIAISYLVSLLSTISLVAIPGEAYDHGITQMLSSLAMPVFAIGAFHLFVRFYFKSRMFTPFDYLEQRFDARIRGLAAGSYLLMRMFYVGMALYATAKVFEGAGSWPKHWTILLVGVVGILYTVLGGLRAVVWTDVIQFFVLAGGILLILSKILLVVPGGPLEVAGYAFEHGRGMPHLQEPSFFSISPYVRVTLWGMLLINLNDMLFYNSCDQIALQRLLSTSSYRQARRSLYLYVALIIPVVACLWFLGLAIFSFYHHQPEVDRPASGDLALYHFISTQLPSPLPGLILASMLAAVMSTLDSGINSLATVATKDLYHRFVHRSASERRQVTFSRWTTFGTGAVAILMGLALSRLNDETGDSVLETSLMWLSLSVALPPVFLLGVTSRRATSRDALITLLFGWIVTGAMVFWYLSSRTTDKPISHMSVLMPCLVLAPIVGHVLARVRPRQSDSRLKNLTLWTLD